MSGGDEISLSKTALKGNFAPQQVQEKVHNIQGNISQEFLHQPQDAVNDGKNVQLTFFQNTEASLTKKVEPLFAQIEQLTKQLEEQKKQNQKLQNNLKTLKKSFEAVIMDQQEQIQNQQKQIDELQDLVTQTLQMSLEQSKQQGELKDDFKQNIEEIQNALQKLQVDVIQNTENINEKDTKTGLSNSQIIEELVKRTVQNEVSTKLQEASLKPDQGQQKQENNEYLFQEAAAPIQDKITQIVEEKIQQRNDDDNKRIEKFISTQIEQKLNEAISIHQLSQTHSQKCILLQNSHHIQTKRNNMQKLHLSIEGESRASQIKSLHNEQIDFSAKQLSYRAQHPSDATQYQPERQPLDKSLTKKRFKPDYEQLDQFQLKNLEKSFRLAQQ